MMTMDVLNDMRRVVVLLSIFAVSSCSQSDHELGRDESSIYAVSLIELLPPSTDRLWSGMRVEVVGYRDEEGWPFMLYISKEAAEAGDDGSAVQLSSSSSDEEPYKQFSECYGYVRITGRLNIEQFGMISIGDIEHISLAQRDGDEPCFGERQ
jgi:hypothetical protein